jgi:ABC-type dipeptide/oligopeptide/nickel transport system ATPase component
MAEQNLTPAQLAEQTADGIPKEFEQAFAKVVKAGMRVMYSEETHELMLDELEGEGDLAQRIGEAIAGLMSLLYEKSNQTMPPEVIIPVGTYLLAKGVDFLEQVTGEQVTPDILAGATDVMVQTIVKQFGIEPEQFSGGMQQAAQQASALEQDGEGAIADEEMAPTEEEM